MKEYLYELFLEIAVMTCSMLRNSKRIVLLELTIMTIVTIELTKLNYWLNLEFGNLIIEEINLIWSWIETYSYDHMESLLGARSCYPSK